jgi:hypothetical protein
MPDRHRTAHDVREVLRAASEKRVHQLCIRESSFLNERLPDNLDRTRLAEDFVNAAAVETLRASGQVLVVPPDHMPAADPVAAILRY